MKLKILFLLLFPLLWSCSSDENWIEPETIDKQICFEIGFAEENNPTTKVTTSSDFKTTWKTDDEIGLFIVKGTSGLQPSGNYANNVKLTRQTDGSWLPSDPIYYPNLTDQLHFYAYYPYDDAMSDPTNHTFSVKVDQRLESDYNKSDLLLAKMENVSKSNNAVQLQFLHAFSLVQIAVRQGVNTPPFTEDMMVILNNVLPETSLGWSTPLTAKGAVAQIVMHKTANMPNTYRALVPAQALSLDSKITFAQTTVGKEISMIYQGIQSTALTAAKTQNFSITLSSGVDPDHVYAVGDVYPHTGSAIGVVFEINSGGKHGKIVSLDQQTLLRWGDNNIDEQAAGVEGIRDSSDGYQGTFNLINKRKDQSDFSTTYSAFYWIYQKNNNDVNGFWYMPPIDELKTLYNVQGIINPKIISVGGAAVSYWYYYSSTEISLQRAAIIDMENGSTTNYPVNKNNVDNNTYIRAIAKF